MASAGSQSVCDKTRWMMLKAKAKARTLQKPEAAIPGKGEEGISVKENIQSFVKKSSQSGNQKQGGFSIGN